MKIIEKYLTWSLPLKLIASSLVFIIAGPGFFYFLTEYATYFYIISQGVRAPFEGVPFLSSSVALLSVLLAFCASLVFIATKLLIALFAFPIIELITKITIDGDDVLKEYHKSGGQLLKKFSFSNIVSSIESLSVKKIMFLNFIFIFIIVVIINIIDTLYPLDKVVPTVLFSLYITVGLFTLWSKNFSWAIAILAVLIFYITSVVFLFDSSRYKVFLQKIGYGGGIPIQVQYMDNFKKTEHLNLIIRTSTALLSERNESCEYSEIPMRNIEKITYKNFTINSKQKVLTKNCS
ncbi:MAG: hypothetical protein V3U87_09550 [Methylococcaceae bacterium]